MVNNFDLFNSSLSDAYAFKSQVKYKKKARIFLCREITIEPIQPLLNSFSSSTNIDLEIEIGGFDTMVLDLLSSKFDFNKFDCIFIFPDYQKIFFNSLKLLWNKDSLIDFFIESMSFFNEICKIIRNESSTRIIFLSPSLNEFENLVISQDRNDLKVSLQKEIIKMMKMFTNIFDINLDRLIQRIGYKNFYDFSRYESFKIPYTDKAMRHIVAEIMINVRQVIGAQRKAIALDCDNTLWGGICGEVDKISNLKIGYNNFPDVAYYKLQMTLKRLKESGVLLILLSKNEESNVLKVFENNPNMILKKDDIAGWQINWERKYLNIRKIAEELNLSLDSFIFVDDTINEIDEIRNFCPEVYTIHLDKENLINFDKIITQLGFFEKSTITKSDKKRTEHYIAEKKRYKEKSKISNYNEYLKTLKMKLENKVDKDVDLSRAIQLTERTNQMNLNNFRANKTDLNNFSFDKDSILISFSVSDKFGDIGEIGLLSISYEKKIQNAKIMMFLLSCRAFGRKIEFAMLETAKKFAIKLGAKFMTGNYYPSKRNSMVKDVFLEFGFKEKNCQKSILFTLDLSHYKENLVDPALNFEMKNV